MIRTALLLTAVAAFAAQAESRIIAGTDAGEALVGTAQNDSLYGHAGDDRLNGAAGDDDLDGGAGADDLRGGAGGDDAAVYDGEAAISVTIDDHPNDGAAGERDNVRRDVENVYTAGGADNLTGNGASNVLDAGPGSDRLTGNGGLDFFYGGPGDDIIVARDGARDIVDCGQGEDIAAVDPADRTTSCTHETDRLPRAGAALAIVRGGFATRLPSGVTQRRGCRGRITLVLRDPDGRRLSRDAVGVSRRCRFEKTFEVPARRVENARDLDVDVRWSGVRGVVGGGSWNSKAVVVRAPRR